MLVPDVAPIPQRRVANDDTFDRALDAIGGALERANQAEDAYAGGTGALADAVYDRARADVVLSVATAAAQRTAQAITTLLNMQL